MAVTETAERVSCNLPTGLFREVERLASEGQRSIEDEILLLVEQGLKRRANLNVLADQANAEYEALLARNGQKKPSTEETWQQLRRARDEVANELDPD